MNQSIPHLNQKGLYDYCRRPKHVYYLYVSQWTSKPAVYIMSHTWTEPQGASGEPKNIRVYSNCDHVELSLNGRSFGQKSRPFAWQVVFESGENQLRAVGQKGVDQVIDSMTVRY